MRSRKTLLAALAVIPLVAAPALAAPEEGFPVVPIEYDPGNLGTITAQWETRIGLPDAGNSDHALHLEKRGNQADVAAAFAEIKNVEGLAVPSTVAFWIPAEGEDEDDYCTNGSPRWNIVTALGVHFLGCAFGEETDSRTDDRGREWIQLTWETNSPQAIPPIPPGTPAQAVYIGADEVGSTYIDDINYYDTMGKPGKGDGSATGEDDA